MSPISIPTLTHPRIQNQLTTTGINDTPRIPLLTNHLLRCAHRQRLRCHPDPGGVSSLHDSTLSCSSTGTAFQNHPYSSPSPITNAFRDPWNTDPAHKKERLSWIGKEVSKFFPTHGAFKGKVQQYHYKLTMPLTTTLSRTKTTMLNVFPTST